MSDSALFDRSLAMIKRLVSYETVSSRSNLDLIDFGVETLKPLGFRFRFTYNDDRTKANLFASSGPEPVAGIILSGHSDVVPPAPSGWKTPPFVADVREGKLYGRGTCDMKGFLGLCLGMAPEFAAARLPLHHRGQDWRGNKNWRDYD